MDHNQYDDSDELNVDMPMSISYEIQSLTNHEGDHFSIEDSSKVQEIVLMIILNHLLQA